MIYFVRLCVKVTCVNVKVMCSCVRVFWSMFRVR